MSKSTKVLGALVVVMGMLLIRSEFGEEPDGVLLAPVEAADILRSQKGEDAAIFTVSDDSKTISVFVFRPTRYNSDRRSNGSDLIPQLVASKSFRVQ